MSDETEAAEAEEVPAGPLGETVNDDGSVTIADAEGEEVATIPSVEQQAEEQAAAAEEEAE
jgi:hypothetical protein